MPLCPGCAAVRVGMSQFWRCVSHLWGVSGSGLTIFGTWMPLCPGCAAVCVGMSQFWRCVSHCGGLAGSGPTIFGTWMPLCPGCAAVRVTTLVPSAHARHEGGDIANTPAAFTGR